MALVKIWQPFLIKTLNKIETDYLFFSVNMYQKLHTHIPTNTHTHNAAVKPLNYLTENTGGIHSTVRNKEQTPINSITI